MKDWDIERSRLRVMALAVIGILITGAVVGLGTALPHYVSMRSSLEHLNAVHVQAQRESVDNLLVGYENITRQMTSRSEIRKRLAAFVHGEMTLEQASQYSQPRLFDAWSKAPDLEAAQRLGPRGEVIATYGTPPAPPLEPGLALITAEDAGKVWIEASAAIHDQDTVVGTDILYFDADALAQKLSDSKRFNRDTQLALYNADNQLYVLSAGGELMPSPLPNDLARLLGDLQSGEAGLKQLGDDSRVFYQPLAALHNTYLLVIIPSRVLYGPASQDLTWVLVSILVMMGLAALSAYWVLKPMVDRITRQSRQIETANAEMLLAASVFESSQEAMVVTDEHCRILRINDAFTDVTGYESGPVTGKNLSDLLSRRQSPTSLMATIWDTLDREDVWQGEIWYRCADSTALPALQTISAVRDDRKRITRLIHIFNDISDHKASQERLEKLAHYDPLTSLRNRATVLHEIDNSIQRSKEHSRQSLALLFIDLDKFKQVNDTLGHSVGDEVLKAVARRLSNTVRRKDLTGRLGGDEFVVLLDVPDTKRYAVQIGKKIVQALCEPFRVADHEIHIGASLGIALFPDDAGCASDLIEQADRAMYNAKRRGGNTVAQTSDHEYPSTLN
ncbi:MAG: hypothetical protein CMI01_12805 [Oceanospirillaceae bacterium]|nr:hypothetical protein [Oceanospirillaceae bacterium]